MTKRLRGPVLVGVIAHQQESEAQVGIVARRGSSWVGWRMHFQSRCCDETSGNIRSAALGLGQQLQPSLNRQSICVLCQWIAASLDWYNSFDAYYARLFGALLERCAQLDDLSLAPNDNLNTRAGMKVACQSYYSNQHGWTATYLVDGVFVLTYNCSDP